MRPQAKPFALRSRNGASYIGSADRSRAWARCIAGLIASWFSWYAY